MQPELVQKSRRERLFRSAFRRVISKYSELKSTDGTVSVSTFYRRLANGVAGTSHTMRATLSDFIADVELAAKAALSSRPDLYKFFKLHYVDGVPVREEDLERITVREMKNDVHEAVGKELMKRKIYPVGVYFRLSPIVRLGG